MIKGSPPTVDPAVKREFTRVQFQEKVGVRIEDFTSSYHHHTKYDFTLLNIALKAFVRSDDLSTIGDLPSTWRFEVHDDDTIWSTEPELTRPAAEADCEAFLLQKLQERLDNTNETLSSEARLSLEAFASLWPLAREGVYLHPEDLRVIDALSQMVAQLAKAQDPPKSVLRSTFEWLAKKLDVAADEAARFGGKTAGVGITIGVGAATASQSPTLNELAHKIIQLLK